MYVCIYLFLPGLWVCALVVELEVVFFLEYTKGTAILIIVH